MPRDARIIESKSKFGNSSNKTGRCAKVSSKSILRPIISPDVAALTTEVSELKNMMKTMLIDKQKAQAPAPVKAVEQSCVTCGGPTIPESSSPKVVEHRTEVTKDTVFPTNNGITKDVQPPVVPVENQNPVFLKPEFCSTKTAKTSVDEPPEVKLKDLPLHLEYAFLEDNNKLPVIIAKDLSVDEKAALIKVLKSQKQALLWTLSDIKRVNPKIHDVIKKEVEKLLDVGLIYPISDSPWVSPVHCVPKKMRENEETNDENKLVPTRLVTGWRVCIDYRKLNEATRKDHFPLPFMDQMLKRLAGNDYYYYLRWFLG
ncbi:hypothetical protein Tco_0692847 [Tanacetum coccineum]